MANILVVEDQKFVAQIIAKYLADHSVLVVHDAEAALDALRQYPVDLVITDVELPGISGLDLLQHMRAAAHVPVIVMTAGGAGRDGDYVESAVGHGATVVLTKPLSKAGLADAVEFALGKG